MGGDHASGREACCRHSFPRCRIPRARTLGPHRHLLWSVSDRDVSGIEESLHIWVRGTPPAPDDARTLTWALGVSSLHTKIMRLEIPSAIEVAIAMHAFNLTFPSPIPDPEEPIANMARNGNSENLTSSNSGRFGNRSGCDTWDSSVAGWKERIDFGEYRGIG